jgi:hypothetical protein
MAHLTASPIVDPNIAEVAVRIVEDDGKAPIICRIRSSATWSSYAQMKIDTVERLVEEEITTRQKNRVNKEQIVFFLNHGQGFRACNDSLPLRR